MRTNVEPLSLRETQGRELDSLVGERSLLNDVRGVLGELSKQSGDYNFRSNMLIENFSQKYSTWQGLGNGQAGLDSGTHGEAFSRLVGSHILEDFPEVVETEYCGLEQQRLILNKEEWEANEKIAFQIESDRFVGDKHLTIYFKFNCSLDEVSDRLKSLDADIEKGKAKYRSML